MAFTFNPELVTDIDRMRDILGDVDEENALAPDETYTARLVTANGSWKLAAASMARSFASRAVNSLTSLGAGGEISLGWANRSTTWLQIARDLEAQVAAEQNEQGDSNVIWTASVTRSDVEVHGEYSYPLNTRRKR